MAFVCQLIEGTEPAINLFYSVADGWAMLEKGLEPNDPERRELWGGYLENVLVRQEDGKREIPLKLQGSWTTPDELIDAVNAVEERLRHAARYRIDGWGDEVFLRFQLHNATFGVDFPISSGSISKQDLMNACGLMMDATGHREAKTLVQVGVTVVCGDPYWEAQETYTLENYIDNPGWWRWAAAPGDSWTEVNAPDLTSTQDTTIYEVMGNSLKQVYVVDAVNDTGVISDAQTVVASTAYYFQVRNYRVTGCDTLTAQVYDISNGAIIAASVLTFNGAVDEWVTQGVSFTTPVGCVSIRVELLCLAGDSVAGGTAYWDAVYLTPGTTAPVAWCSGRNLVNCLTPTADQINVLCVTEIPGEVEAEVSYALDLTQGWDQVQVAKRTRENPHNFIWELLGVNAVVTAGDAACINSALAADGNAPGGQRVVVNFAGNQNMVLRTYWNISANLADYYGRYQFGVLVSKSANTDVVEMRVEAYNDISLWSQGYAVKQTIAQAAANEWGLYEGWDLFSFPIGTHDDDLWDTGNRWQIRLYASITGAAAWDDLWIAGLYLIPVDDAFVVAGPLATMAAGVDATLKDLDGMKGLFARSVATNRYYNNCGYVGKIPRLSPEIENWLYFIIAETYVAIADPLVVSVTYRPRGIFLRGSNP